MAGVHLAIKVQQLLLGPDLEDPQGLYCVLSTGSTRFSTGKASSSELFLISPWELSHAAKKPLPASQSPSTQHDSSKPLSSPVLTVDLLSAKRWGADAVVASGELLLGPWLEQLQPNMPGVCVTVSLTKAGGKATSKAAKQASAISTAAAAAAAAPGARSSSEAVPAPDAQAVVLQLSTVTAPAVPEQLLGPVGTGKAEVPPRFCADAAWLNWRQPVLHTGAGHLYRVPTVQLLRVTLHKAQGLLNLHVDPLAAAAAAAAIGRMAATGVSPSRTDRAKAAAEKAVLDGTRAGLNLLQNTSSWFKRSKSSAAVAAASPSPGRQSPLSYSRSSAGLASSSTTGRAGTSASAAAAADVRPASPSAAWFPASADGSTAAAAAAAAGAPAPGSSHVSPDRNSTVAVEGAAADGDPSVGVSGRGCSGSSSQYDASADPQAPGGLVGGSPTARNPNNAATQAVEQAIGQATPGMAAAAAAGADAVQRAEEAAGRAVGGFVSDSTSQSPASLADPVSLLKRATQHARNSSVDAEAVMAALEENGFHATDAFMGAFFYTRISLLGVCEPGSSSSSCCSKVVALSLAGEAVWDQGFWLPVVRPAPAGALLELELYAAKDDKTRGKLVASVRAPLQQLLPDAHPEGDSMAWARASHVLQASFSDHLHCSVSLTVEVADWDMRAQLANTPRVLPTAMAAAAAAATASAAAAATAAAGGKANGVQNPLPPAAAAAAAGATGAGAAIGEELCSSPAATAAAAGGTPVGMSPPDSPHIGRQRSGASLAGLEATPTSAAAGAAVAAAATGSSAGFEAAAVAGAEQQQPVAVLDMVVKAFDTHKPLDVFFVLLMGPYCLVSSTSHSTQHHHWGWHLKLPVMEPAEMITLALMAREDQAGGRKRVGAPLLTLFSSSIKLVGKLRFRLSSLPCNTPLNLSMPLQGERTNLRAGQASAATAHLYLQLSVPQLVKRYLPAYAAYSATSPALYLLSTSPEVVGPDSTLEALATEVQATTARWVEQQPPMLPAKVFRKVQDDGRGDFTLSRTRANWRRLTLLRDATAPARQAFSHLCSWDNPWHSGGWYCVILLFGVYPSKVLSVALVLLVASMLRAVMRPSQAAVVTGAAAAAAATTATAAAVAASAKAAKPGAAAAAAGAGVGAAAAAAAVVAGGGASSSSWQLLPLQPPPVMWDPSYSSPEEAQQTAVPTDPYTSLKQNYEAVIGFLTLVQNVIDGWASAGERLQLAFSWTDPLATSVLVVLMLLLALGLWVLGLQVLVTAGLLWVFRHPTLRSPLPPPPVNFVCRLPTRADTML